MKTLATLTLCILATALALEAQAARIGAAPGTMMTYRGTNVLPRVAMDKDYFGWDGTSMWVIANGTFSTDVDLNCNDLLEVHSQTDCNGCYTHYSDGAIGVPSGVIYYGCTSNTPAVGDMKCSNEVWTTEELIASESGGFFESGGTTRRFMRYTCREWDGDSWEVVDNQDIDGTVNIHGNLLLMDGWGTNIISAGSTGNILAGTNNGVIYIGPNSLGNSIHVNISRAGGTAGLHVGTNSSYNIIQGEANGASVRIDNNVRNNRISFRTEYNGFWIRNNVWNSDIHATRFDGGVGNLWDIGNITNCAIRGSASAGDGGINTASNLMGCTISVPTNVANLANAVIGGSLGLPGATVDGIESTLTDSSSKIPTSAAVSNALPHVVFVGVLSADISESGAPSPTNASFDQIVFDAEGGWSAESNCWFVTESGSYGVSGGAAHDSLTAGIVVSITTNDSAIVSAGAPAVTATADAWPSATLPEVRRHLSAGVRVALAVRHDEGGNILATANGADGATWMQIVRYGRQ